MASDLISKDLCNMSVKKEILELSKKISKGNMPLNERTRKRSRKKREEMLNDKDMNTALRNVIAAKKKRIRPRRIEWDNADTDQDTLAEQKSIYQNTTSLLFKSMGVDYQSLGEKIPSREGSLLDNPHTTSNTELQNHLSGAEEHNLETTDSVHKSDEVVDTPSQNESISDNEPSGKVFSLPYQPPNFTTMKAFKTLLRQHRRLVYKCGSENTTKKSKLIKSECGDISQPPCSVSSASSTGNPAMFLKVNSDTGGISVNVQTGNYFSASSSSFANVSPCVRRRKIGNFNSGVVTGGNEITMEGGNFTSHDSSIKDKISSQVLNNPNVESSVCEVPQTSVLNTTTTSTLQHSEGPDASKRSVDFDPHLIDQLITAASLDSAYQKLKARFQALFLWPALLSTVKRPEFEDTNRTKKEKNVDGKSPKKNYCSTPPHSYNNSDVQSNEKTASETKKSAKKPRYM